MLRLEDQAWILALIYFATSVALRIPLKLGLDIYIFNLFVFILGSDLSFSLCENQLLRGAQRPQPNHSYMRDNLIDQ